MSKYFFSFVILVTLTLSGCSPSLNTPLSKFIQSFVRVNNGGCGTVIKCTEELNSEGPIKYRLYVLTAAHVVLAGQPPEIDAEPEPETPQNEPKILKIKGEFPIYSENGLEISTNEYVGDVVEVNEELDFAIISYLVDEPVVPVAVCREVSLTESVVSVGGPATQKFWIGRGIISSLVPDKLPPGYIGQSSFLYMGHSGGPLFNEKGEQIGINLRLAGGMFGEPIPNMGYSLRLSVVLDVLGEKASLYFK